MTDATLTRTNWRVRLRASPLLGPALLLSLAAYLLLCLLTARLSAMPASAMPPSVTPGGSPTYTPTPTITNTRTPVPPITATPPPCGLAWRVVDSFNPSSDSRLGGVAAVSPDDVWAVGSYVTGTVPTLNTLIEHWDGTSWTQVPSPSPHNSTLIGAAAVSANDVWAVGYSSPCCGADQVLAEQSLIEHWDGNQWSIIQGAIFPYTQTNTLRSVVAISTNDVWAVGYYSQSIGGGGWTARSSSIGTAFSGV